MLRLSWVSQSLLPEISMRGDENMNPLFVGIDMSSKSNVAYLVKEDGSKHNTSLFAIIA